MSLDDKLTMDVFLAMLAKTKFIVSNFWQARDGTWFVAAESNGVYYYGRDKELGICLRQCWRQVSGEGRSWRSFDELMKNPTKPITKKTPERIRLKSTPTRIRL